MVEKIFHSIKEVLWNWIFGIFVILDFIGFIQEKFTHFKITFGYMIFLGLLASAIKINYKNQVRPNIELYRFKFKNLDRFLIKVHNMGGEDIKDFKISYKCLLDGKIESDILKQYHNEHENYEDMAIVKSHECTYLKKDEAQVAKGIPFYSDDGKISLTTSGVGVKSGEKLKREFTLNNEIKNNTS